MKSPDNREPKETSRLEAEILDSQTILITEHNIKKRRNEKLFGKTFSSIRTAIESRKANEIPPIVVLQNPFRSIDETIQAYQAHIKAIPRQGGVHYEQENDTLREILEQNALLCYNGNRRLEEFQRVGIPIKAFIIKSQEEFEQIPSDEKRIPKKLKDERPKQYQIDQDFILCYLTLLDDVVYICSEKKHFDNFDSKKELALLKERKKGNLQ